MTLNDPLSNVLSHIDHYERLGHKLVHAKNNSKLIREVLNIMQEEGYIGGYEQKEDRTLNINLLGNLNKCGVIKPRFRISLKDFEKYEKRYLPAKDFGILIISTSKGLMTHIEAKQKRLGGTLISYAY